MRRTIRTLGTGDSVELVATLVAGSPESSRVPHLPHWRRAAGHSAAELSKRLAYVLRTAGERGEVGRAFCGRHRESREDPFSAVIEATAAELATGMSRVIRLRVGDPGAVPRIADGLIDAQIAESVHTVMPRAMTELDPFMPGALPSSHPGGWAVQRIRLDEALDLEPGDAGVVVAVLDSGVDGRHREFGGKLTRGYDFVDLTDGDDALRGDVTTRDADATDDTGHGTHVAGVIGARGEQMYRGAAGEGRIMPVRVLGTRMEDGRRVGVGIVPDIDDGLKFAVDSGADVINLSLGVEAVGSGIPHRRAIEYARLHDVVVVAASGNHGGDAPLFPAAVPGVITVGALNELSRVADFSAWGSHVDIVAPGTAIFSTDLGGRYRYRDGTSHAAPFVAGVAALLIARARRSGVQVRERTIRRILRDTADAPGTERSDLHAGAGVLNAADAIMLLSHLIRAHQRDSRTRNEPPPLERIGAAA